MILLDTNVVVAHLNGDAAVTAKISSHIDEIAVPALVVAELDYGAKASGLQCVEPLTRLCTRTPGGRTSIRRQRRAATAHEHTPSVGQGVDP